MRTTLVLGLLAAVVGGGCSGINPAPYAEGTWCGMGHFQFLSDSLDEDVSGGSKVDQTTLGVDLGAGYFVMPSLSVTGYGVYTDEETKVNSVKISELSSWDALIGVRYHFMYTGRSRPWVEVLAGMSQLDLGGGADDTAFTYGAAVGWNEFVTNSTAVEVMARYTRGTYTLTPGIDSDRDTWGIWAGWAVYW